MSDPTPPQSGRKLRGLFVNTSEANCSIYESGRMVYKCLQLSGQFEIDYTEVTRKQRTLPGGFDFYAFNYHHVGMDWLDTKSVSRLPGLKATFILETLPNNPFVLCPVDAFDVYCALDPTMYVPKDKRVYAFPRPLDSTPALPPFEEPPLPVIGTFGFATPGKGFELVVDAVNKEFSEAVVRINLPPGTYSDPSTYAMYKCDYADYLAEQCRQRANPNVRIEITRDYLTKEELILWCSRNTLNCFLYNRNQPGLSATTDQAITSGRPLAVSGNETFRHIHPYLQPYPAQSLKESIATSRPQVRQMQEDWSPQSFAFKFEEVLRDFELLGKPLAALGGTADAIQLEILPPPSRAWRLYRRAKRLARPAVTLLRKQTDEIRATATMGIARLRRAFAPKYDAEIEAIKRNTSCKFLRSRDEIALCRGYLQRHGYVSHAKGCKDWDLANIVNDLSDGNMLDMGSSDSYVLKNARLKPVSGELHGIDLKKPDVSVSGVKYLVGDLMATPYPDFFFQNITCLSVIEHEVDFQRFAKESSRLLSDGGKLYVTFDYWNPKVIPKLRIFGKNWNILDENDVRQLITACADHGLKLADEVDWSLQDAVINDDYHSPDPAVSYTFGMVVFKKERK